MQMAKFLQETIKDMAVSSKNPNKKESVEEFARFFEKVCTCVITDEYWCMCVCVCVCACCGLVL